MVFITMVMISIKMLKVNTVITIMRDDSPGAEGSVQASQHPEQTQPAQVLTPFIHLQELSKVRVHNGDRATYSVENKEALGGTYSYTVS